MTSPTAASFAHHSPRLPQFVTRRVERYEAETIRAEHTAHVLLGAVPLSAGDVDLRSNDYLALGRHPEVIAAQVRELQASANGQMMSAVFLTPGNAQWDLEDRFARLLQAGAGVLFQSGYLANVALLQNIADATTPVYLDMMAHASLYQGVVAAGADLRVFRHNDAEHLKRQVLTRGPGVIAIDSVYSIDGSVAPIAAVLAVAEETGCALIVDESHSLGTHGPGGAGLVVASGLQHRVHFRTASLAKALCGRAGLVACPESVAYYLHIGSSPNIFSSAVLPHELAALGKTLEIVQRDEWRRVRLHRNADWLRAQLDVLGYNVSASRSQIISLEAGTEERVVELGFALQKCGIFGAVFFSPATPKNRACIRFSVHAGLAPDDLERVISACAEIRDRIGVANWPSSRRIARRAGAAGKPARTDQAVHGLGWRQAGAERSSQARTRRQPA